MKACLVCNITLDAKGKAAGPTKYCINCKPQLQDGFAEYRRMLNQKSRDKIKQERLKTKEVNQAQLRTKLKTTCSSCGTNAEQTPDLIWTEDNGFAMVYHPECWTKEILSS